MSRNLKSKAILGLANQMLTFGMRIIVNLAITPIITSHLGKSIYGIWVLITQINTYVSPFNLKVAEPLKYELARSQHLEDFAAKQRFCGAAATFIAGFIPFVLLFGGVWIVLLPKQFGLSGAVATNAQIAMGITAISISLLHVFSIPGSVLRGENQDFRALGLKSALVLLESGLGVALILGGFGVAGLATANFLATIGTCLLTWHLARKYVPWMALARPSKSDLKVFWGRFVWVMLGGFGWIGINNFDFALVGLLISSGAVAQYSLTGSLSRMLFMPALSAAMASNPGISGLCGSEQWDRLARARRTFDLGLWSCLAVVGVVIVHCNSAFVHLWVGSQFFGGKALSLLLMLQIGLTSLLQAELNILDGFLEFRWRCTMQIAAAAIAVPVSIGLISHLGLAGAGVGGVIGRILMLVGVVLVVNHSIRRRGGVVGAFPWRLVSIVVLLLGGVMALPVVGKELWQVCLEGAVLAAVSGAICLGIGMSRADRQLLFALPSVSKLMSLIRGRES